MLAPLNSGACSGNATRVNIGEQPQYKPAQSVAAQVGSTSALLSEIDAFTPGAAQSKLMVSPRFMQNDHRIPLARRAPDNAVIIVFKNKIKPHRVQSIYGRERKTNTPLYSDKFEINSSLSFTCPLLECYFFAFHFCLNNLT